MSFNLKDILNPKTCGDCKFCYESDDHEFLLCDLLDESLADTEDEEFNPCDSVYVRCPLLRIKCENCKHHSLWPDGASYCNKFAYDCVVACIEFEDVG